MVWKDEAGSYMKFGEFNVYQDGLVLEDRVAPECICWAASLKYCSSLRAGWLFAVEKGQEMGQAEL